MDSEARNILGDWLAQRLGCTKSAADVVAALREQAGRKPLPVPKRGKGRPLASPGRALAVLEAVASLTDEGFTRRRAFKEIAAHFPKTRDGKDASFETVRTAYDNALKSDTSHGEYKRAVAAWSVKRATLLEQHADLTKRIKSIEGELAKEQLDKTRGLLEDVLRQRRKDIAVAFEDFAAATRSFVEDGLPSAKEAAAQAIAMYSRYLKTEADEAANAPSVRELTKDMALDVVFLEELSVVADLLEAEAQRLRTA